MDEVRTREHKVAREVRHLRKDAKTEEKLASKSRNMKLNLISSKTFRMTREGSKPYNTGCGS